MQIEGQRIFAAPPEAVFAALVDPHLAAATIPGLHDFQVDSPERWHGTVRLPVGPKLRFTFELAERVEPSHARLLAHGKALGGSVLIETAFDLEPAEDGGTLMRYVARAELTGLLGHLGEHVLKPIAEHQVHGALRAIERRLAERATG
jgi:carbon monoxide dehydrogenase subunit G